MKLIEQDILEITDGILAHQVNSVGVAGAGLALRLSELYPDAMQKYKRARPSFGSCLLVPVKNNLYIANLVGQKEYGREHRQTHYGALAHSLMDLNELISLHQLRHLPVYFPYNLGSGNGGGDWNVVSELLEFFFPEDTICKLPGSK